MPRPRRSSRLADAGEADDGAALAPRPRFCRAAACTGMMLDTGEDAMVTCRWRGCRSWQAYRRGAVDAAPRPISCMPATTCKAPEEALVSRPSVESYAGSRRATPGKPGGRSSARQGATLSGDEAQVPRAADRTRAQDASGLLASDLRVVLLRLASRLQTLALAYAGQIGATAPRRLARESRSDVFAPLANRLGIWQIKWEAGGPGLPLPAG